MVRYAAKEFSSCWLQAYRPAIAEAAVGAQRFVYPVSLHRTDVDQTVHPVNDASQWLGEHARPSGGSSRCASPAPVWEEALSQAVLTTPEARVYGGREEWRERFARAVVRHEMSAHVRSGHIERAEARLPHEVPYSLDDALAIDHRSRLDTRPQRPRRIQTARSAAIANARRFSSCG